MSDQNTSMTELLKTVQRIASGEMDMPQATNELTLAVVIDTKLSVDRMEIRQESLEAEVGEIKTNHLVHLADDIKEVTKLAQKIEPMEKMLKETPTLLYMLSQYKTMPSIKWAVLGIKYLTIAIATITVALIAMWNIPGLRGFIFMLLGLPEELADF